MSFCLGRRLGGFRGGGAAPSENSREDQSPEFLFYSLILHGYSLELCGLSGLFLPLSEYTVI